VILSLTIATGLLAVLDDDSGEVDYNELWMRTFTFHNRSILMDKLDAKQKEALADEMATWISSSENLDILKERIDATTWLFNQLFTTPEPPTFGGNEVVFLDTEAIEYADNEELTAKRNDIANHDKDPVLRQSIENAIGGESVIREALSWDEHQILFGLDQWDEKGDYAPTTKIIRRSFIDRYANEDDENDDMAYSQSRAYMLKLIDATIKEHSEEMMIEDEDT
jgi:hypothetical protein